ncbi:hypothetical protein LguiA_001620 [Lonicera macranthoides]
MNEIRASSRLLNSNLFLLSMFRIGGLGLTEVGAAAAVLLKFRVGEGKKAETSGEVNFRER